MLREDAIYHLLLPLFLAVMALLLRPIRLRSFALFRVKLLDSVSNHRYIACHGRLYDPLKEILLSGEK